MRILQNKLQFSYRRYLLIDVLAQWNSRLVSWRFVRHVQDGDRSLTINGEQRMTPARIWTSLIVVCVGLMLASCQTVALKPPTKIFHAGDFKPLMINARRLEIVDSWTMPMAGPHVGHRANPLPSISLAAWASRVLQPAGGSVEMVFDVRKASITLTQLPL